MSGPVPPYSPEQLPAPASRGSTPWASLGKVAHWLWVAPVGAWNAAFDWGGEGEMARAMCAHFDSVHYIPGRAATARRDGTSEHPANLQTHPVADGALPFADASLDCVALSENLADLLPVEHRRDPRRASGLAALRECRRVLGPGGTLLFTAENSRCLPWLRARGRFEAAMAGGRVIGLLREAGFAKVERYYLLTFLERPVAIVPARAAAVASFEGLHCEISLRRRARRALLSRLHAFRFAMHLVVAER